MGNVAVTSGFAPVLAGTGPAFVVLLIPHILAGLTAVAAGAAVMVSRKGTRRHMRMGTAYFWALAALVATAAGLTAIRGPRDLPVFGLGVLALVLASAGRYARRHPRTQNPGPSSHILAMTSSYTVMLTAFYVDNGKNLPLADRLPQTAYWLLPAVIAAPLIVRSVRCHRGPGPTPRGRAGPDAAPAPSRPDDDQTTRRTRTTTKTGTPSCTR
jgi:hypothetical protein